MVAKCFSAEFGDMVSADIWKNSVLCPPAAAGKHPRNASQIRRNRPESGPRVTFKVMVTALASNTQLRPPPPKLLGTGYSDIGTPAAAMDASAAWPKAGAFVPTFKRLTSRPEANQRKNRRMSPVEHCRADMAMMVVAAGMGC
jgi:hypothetical protein